MNVDRLGHVHRHTYRSNRERKGREEYSAIVDCSQRVTGYRCAAVSQCLNKTHVRELSNNSSFITRMAINLSLLFVHDTTIDNYTTYCRIVTFYFVVFHIKHILVPCNSTEREF